VLQSFASVFVIVWLNLTNDVFDHETGVDVDKKESVVNRTGERDTIFWVANVLLAVGVITFVGVILQAKQGLAGAMLFASICIGYLYQGPPFRLSYKGLGEILCFFAFGPLATTAFFLIQSGLRASDVLGQPLAICAAVLVGLTTSNILLNSHYHQVKTDESSGKKSPAVRFGTKNVARATCAKVAVVYAIYIAGLARGVVPTSTLLFTPLSVVSALKLCKFVLKNHANEAVIKPAKFLAVQWHRNFAVLFSLGLLLCP
jgi:1,4-dihydroxy-2-naphthoate octaprenyltransferase